MMMMVVCAMMMVLCAMIMVLCVMLMLLCAMMMVLCAMMITTSHALLQAAAIEEAYQDDKYELDDCENEVTRISDVLDKAGPNSILHSDIGAFVQLLKGKLTMDRAPQRTSFHSYRVESISEFELVKKAYLTDLHKRLIIAQLKFKASQRRWIVLIDQYKRQQVRRRSGRRR